MIRVAGIADKMAKNQKQIAISEFFEKNKHFLGFDSLQRSIITAVKEAVDNSLDACEEARILPDIRVKISKIDSKKDILELQTEDNGPVFLRRVSRKYSVNSYSVRDFTQYDKVVDSKESELLEL